ncbi:methyltransferase family protein [Marinobacter sp. F4216]|uniref:methyltransferase family protein n=1 Tax=Marinobacter sp. F4216 TaxID=2874281 RepID=UPI0021DA394B|nr:isoprenylcysteine carboxylmethyltransferase family protein [Marinobacter sp. F4216]
MDSDQANLRPLELKIPPVVLVIIVAVGMWAIARVSPSLAFSLPGTAGWAIGVAVAGVGIALLGVLEFRAAGTTVDPRVPEQSASLVVGGVYQHSRNPMYLGFLLVLIAWGLYLGSVLALLFLPAFIVYMNRFQIAPEERFMHEKFGASYDQYRSEVRRWI